jgi:hypothetical protein
MKHALPLSQAPPESVNDTIVAFVGLCLRSGLRVARLGWLERNKLSPSYACIARGLGIGWFEVLC